MLVIANDHWQIGILPGTGTGASLAFGRTRLADGGWYDVLRFGARSWQLRRNAGDGTAMHGAGHEFPCELSYPLERAMAVGAPGSVPAPADYRRKRPLDHPSSMSA